MSTRRASSRQEVLSVVERGWRGARECSLVLNAMAIPVTHLIKGYLSLELRAMIRPYPHIAIISVARPLFRPWLWWVVVTRTLIGTLRWILVDHERTLLQLSWWCRMFGLTLVSIRETDHGYELWIGNQQVPFTAVFQDASRPGV